VKRAEEKYKDEGLTVLWIGFQDRRDRIRKFAELQGISRAGFDEGDRVSKAFGIRYGAGVAFVNSGGIVKARMPKGFSSGKLEDNIKRILK